jgi:hypothetical protein
MKRAFPTALVLVFLSLSSFPAGEKAAPAKTPKEALRAFNDLIGSWKGTGIPYGSFEERQKGFWQEKVSWVWRFKGKEVWLEAKIEEGKYYTGGQLRYLPATDRYALTLHTVGKESLRFEGPLEKHQLTLDYTDPKTKRGQRVIVNLLHANRYLFRHEVKRPGTATFRRQYQVGNTKKGVPFARGGSNQPECVVSGGLGTIPVSYKGKTYYVCCTGCRDAFEDNPEKYIKEFEARQKKKK